MGDRLNKSVLIAGKPGAGKTTYIKELIDKYPGKVLIVDINREKAYSIYPLIKPEEIKTHSHGEQGFLFQIPCGLYQLLIIIFGTAW